MYQGTMDGNYLPQQQQMGMAPPPQMGMAPPPQMGMMNQPPMNVMSVVSNYGDIPKEAYNTLPNYGVDPTQNMAAYYQSTGMMDPQTPPSTIPNMRPFINFNIQELSYYKNLWNLVDPQNTGYVDGPSGAEFLQKSSLPHDILMEVWNIADPGGLGMLDSQAFFCACRLVAHVQNGSLLSPEAVNIEPAALPNFDLTKIKSPDAIAYESVPQGPPPVVEPVDTSFPTTMNADPNQFRSTQAFNWDDMMNRLPTVSVEELAWNIPEEFQLKYRHLFHMYDSNSDGYIEGHEARKFFYTSGLTKNELSLIWELSDQDNDGRLSLPEFAVAVHLIQCRQKSMPIPSQLPQELAKIISNGIVSAKSQKDAPVKASSNSNSPILSSLKKTEGEVKKSEGRSLSAENTVGFNASVEELGEAAAGGVPASIVERLTEGDRRIRKSLAMDVDAYADELRSLSELNDKIREDVVAERKEIARHMERKSDFHQRVIEERQKFEKLKEERRQCELERVAANRDIHHYDEELAFLRRQVQDAQNDIKQLEISNLVLEKTHQRTDGYISTLDTARRTVVNALRTERSLLAEEEKEISELRNSLDRMKHDKDDAQSRNSVLQERLRQADQDRMLLVSSIESERAKLLAVKDSRLRLANDRRSVAQEIANVAQQTWKGGEAALAGSSPPPYPSYYRTANSRLNEPAASVPYGGKRDAKGIPAGFSPPPIRESFPNSRGWNEKVPEKGIWTVFGKSEPSEKAFSVQRGVSRKESSHEKIGAALARPAGSVVNLEFPNSVSHGEMTTPAVEEWKASPPPISLIEEDAFSANFDDFADFTNGMDTTDDKWKKLGVGEVTPPLDGFTAS